MRLNNANKAGRYYFMNTLALMVTGLCVVLFILERYKFHTLGSRSWLLLILAVLILSLLFVRGRQFFSYDSDGEALNFKNRHLYPFLSKDANDEFPKYKLKNFEIFNAVIFKRLYITIDSKKNHSLTLKYDISNLTGKELNDLRASLGKVVKANNQRNSTNGA